MVGKNLFYFFGGSGKDAVVLHFHFGMSGAFKTFELPGEEPKPTTRLQLVCQEAKLMAHLSAMTVQHGGLGAVPLSWGQRPVPNAAPTQQSFRRPNGALNPPAPCALLPPDLYEEKYASLGPDPLRCAITP